MGRTEASDAPEEANQDSCGHARPKAPDRDDRRAGPASAGTRRPQPRRRGLAHPLHELRRRMADRLEGRVNGGRGQPRAAREDVSTRAAIARFEKTDDSVDRLLDGRGRGAGGATRSARSSATTNASDRRDSSPSRDTGGNRSVKTAVADALARRLRRRNRRLAATPRPRAHREQQGRAHKPIPARGLRTDPQRPGLRESVRGSEPVGTRQNEYRGAGPPPQVDRRSRAP